MTSAARSDIQDPTDFDTSADDIDFSKLGQNAGANDEIIPTAEQHPVGTVPMEQPATTASATDDFTSGRRESFSRSRASVGLSFDATTVANTLVHPDPSWTASHEEHDGLRDTPLETDDTTNFPLAHSPNDGDSELYGAEPIPTPEAYERAGAFDAFDSTDAHEPDWLGSSSNAPSLNTISDMRDSLMVDPANPAMAAISDLKTPDAPREDPLGSSTAPIVQEVGETDDSWDKLVGGEKIVERDITEVSTSEVLLISQTNEQNTNPIPSQPPVDLPKPVENSWAEAFEDEDEEEDQWSKALTADKPGKGASWDNLFEEDDFDDDDLLGDSPQPTSLPQAIPQAAHPPSLPIPASTSIYTATPPIQNSKPSPQDQNSGGMKFFEDLPMTQTVRRSRPKPPAPATSPGPPPPPQTSQPAAPLPPPQPNASSYSQYGHFQKPEKLDLFPQQATAPTLPTPPSSNYAPSPQQKPPSNTRYSPSQTQLVVPSKYSAAPPPPQSSRYSTQLAQPPNPTIQPPGPNALDPSALPSVTTNSFLPPQQAPPSRGSASSPPSTATRYSPSQSVQFPPTQSKPPMAPPVERDVSPLPPPPANRFAPRTSSPLASHEHRAEPMAAMRSSLDQIPIMAPSSTTVAEATISPPQLPPQERLAQRYSPALAGPSSSSDTTQKEANAPAHSSYQRQSSSRDLNGQPLRAPTQSTETSRLPIAPTNDRPISSHDTKPAPSRFNRAPARQKSVSSTLEFVIPEDPGQAQDPLQRWKGSPVFRWSAGGICTAFPQRVPRYSGGQAAPMLKCMPGDIKVQPSKDTAPIEDILISFPGPLKSKNKKKDVLNWLSARIQTLEDETRNSQLNGSDYFAASIRLEEKLLLWQVLRIFVENDGILAGNPNVESAVRQLLVQPGLSEIASAEPTETTTTTEVQPEPNQAGVTDAIRQNLLRGEREKAVWHAADNRMWGHALLISSTLDQALHKQVVQEFVRKEVRNKGQGNLSLAALYEVLAGNWDESIDELVPASARAGFQMMSTAVTPGQHQDALQGLTKWRETLGLILGNRRSDDEKGILALGNLLAGYGRVEAAHICFLFAKSVTRIGGADDQQANFTLLGANVRDPTFEAGHDLEAVLLSEVYEFALSLLPSASAYYLPHLQAYKLHHAYILAECGRTSDALQYCEAILLATKSMTRGSPYYHVTLMTQLDDLHQRLSKSSKDGGSGWISKPSIEKVSGSMWARFNSFVAGDEAEASSTPGSGTHSEGEFGPFAGIRAGTPTISRSNSNADLYGNIALPKRTSSSNVNSRYAPNNTGSGQTDGEQSTYSPYAPMAQNVTGYGTPPAPSQSYLSSSYLGAQSSYGAADHLEVSSQRSQGSSSYEPYVPSVPEEMPSQQAASFDQPEPSSMGYSPKYGGHQFNGVPPTMETSSNYGSYEPSMSGYEPPTGGYEPPTSTYQPYEPDSAEPLSPETPAAGPKSRKGIMEDDSDQDFASQSASLKAADKARADREADDAVRRAAEADAARDAQEKQARRSSGWLGGWFGGGSGKKDSKDQPTVYKAKLGEESSFFYDPVAKKWVNKKDPNASATTSAPTPPPPMGPPSRTASGAGTPPMGSAHPPAPPSMNRPPMSTPPMGATPPSAIPNLGGSGSNPPSRMGTPASNAGSDAPPSLPSTATAPTSVPTEGSGLSASGLPSRSATSLSNASSIDDLMGVPGQRKGAAAKKGKRVTSRYVDVMGQGGVSAGSGASATTSASGGLPS